MSRLTRRAFCAAATASAAATLAAPAFAHVRGHGLDYLEGLAFDRYLAPSALDLAYELAIYVNTAFSGDGMQKMWVLGRTEAGWDRALVDDTLGPDAGWSWPVSSGTFWPGNDRAGPTPTGIFNVDERRFRHRTGWGSPGMYKAVYIDLHYTSGRVSGVAVHGTDSWQYRRLGRPASHGCVRMTQGNMDRTWALLHPGGASGPESPLWGEMPRYFRSAPEDSTAARRDYVRDGTLLRDEDGALLTKEGYRAVFVFFRDDLA